MKKTTITETINKLPNEFELEDLLEKIIVLSKIEKAEEDIKNGKIVNTEDIINHFNKKWVK